MNIVGIVAYVINELKRRIIFTLTSDNVCIMKFEMTVS